MPSSSNSCTPVTRPSGSWMMDRKRGVATLVAASVMVVGGASGAAAATPRTAPAPVAVVATSASTVTNLLSAAGGSLDTRARLVSIGPVTTAALRDRGLERGLERLGRLGRLEPAVEGLAHAA